MQKVKKYWKGLEQLKAQSDIVDKLEKNEFVEEIPVEKSEDKNSSRRDFIKYLGFSTTAAAIAGCEGPVIKSVPYVVQPEQIIPGVANYYATAIADGNDFRSILVKTREGRPIKIQNNKDAKSFNCSNARVTASVLDLYDTYRIQGPKVDGNYVSWDDFNNQIKGNLENLINDNKRIVLLTQTQCSPTTKLILDKFLSKYSNIEHIEYDTISSSSALDAFENIYGIRALADYDFSKAETIVSVDADFLSDWQGGSYSSGWSKTRVPNAANNNSMSYHIQFESNMTLSGANADNRVPANPSELKKILAHIYSRLSGQPVNGSLNPNLDKYVDLSVKKLKSSGTKSVLISGIDDVNAQEMVLMINDFLNSDVIDIKSPRLIRSGRNSELLKMMEDLKSGKISGMITSGINPGYSLPESEEFLKIFKNLEFTLSFSMKEDETSRVAKFLGASSHYLESWGDYEFKTGHYYLAQPTIRPLFDTKQFQDVILSLIGADTNFYDEIKSNWKNNILSSGKTWGKSLQDGFFYDYSQNELSIRRKRINLNLPFAESSNEFSLVLYPKVGMGDGQRASNPWLQEFPDPITRVTWDNYITLSITDAKKLKLKNYNVANGALNGSYAKITSNRKEIIAPVIIQPGQAPGTIGLSFGYGKKYGMSDEMKVGINAFNLYNDFNKIQKVNISKVKGDHEFACIQLHNTMMGRDEVIKETTLEIFNTKDKSYWNPTVMVSKNHIETKVTSPEVDIWRDFDRSIGHHFNLSIDLNSCNGCGACVIACTAENNVPVVGKEEVRRSRDMHWIRIDRYYSSEDTIQEDIKIAEEAKGFRKYKSTLNALEQAAENPQVVFQPITCMHCNHAPCETVCPVAATSHGRQGQNQMAYNRCVGTRYCANNCPYKVRRFNWFSYADNDEFDYNLNNPLGKMVLNPDVTIRSRGVMEKCSLCIQVTQKVILDAKRDGRKVTDKDWKTACSDACSNGAIVFGDVNDKESEISKVREGDRTYRVLESVGTKPNVIYQTIIRNNINI
tara:strand:- start:265 stop:3318 length:3054 start_codon:yes stop_codon:yes gene_type:complete